MTTQTRNDGELSPTMATTDHPKEVPPIEDDISSAGHQSTDSPPETTDDEQMSIMASSLSSLETPQSTPTRLGRSSRPAGMRERMQQRLRQVQSERHLDADDVSVASSRRQRASVKDRVAASFQIPSIRRMTSPTAEDSGDGLLLLQLTQKLRQLEQDKSHLMEQHEEEVSQFQHRIHSLESQKAKLQKKPSDDVQNKLNEAMAKIAKMEENQQDQKDVLEQKLQDAQVTIAHLRLQSHSTAASPPKSQDVESRQEVTPEKEAPGDSEERKPASPLADTEPPQQAFTYVSVPSPTPSRASFQPPSETDDDSDARSLKLEKLKAFRRSRESQLKELVLDSQNSPTDVQSVIVFLQNELKTAKELIAKQKTVIQEAKQSPTLDALEEDTIESWKQKHQDLQRRYTALELDRAYGEFQLRDRITSDALKFHRRLRHWKEQTQDLQTQLEQCMEQKATEGKTLRQKVEEQTGLATSATQDFQAYKEGTEQSLNELSLIQERLARTERELEKLRQVSPHSDATNETVEQHPELIQQAKLLQAAKERKEEKTSWSTRITGVLRRGDVEHRHQMG